MYGREYQNIRVEPPDKKFFHQEMKQILAGNTGNIGRLEASDDISNDIIEFVYSSFSSMEWKISASASRGRLPVYDSPETYVSVEFNPPTAKLYCSICERKEAYNFLYGQDLLDAFRGVERLVKPTNTQIFSLAYQCQSCKSTPEIFMVRREDLKLTQSGRTPIEEIEIPSYLPKPQRNFFSDALLAFNSGQVLAGNFLLRTFIEQYVRSRSLTPDTQDTDALFSEYGGGLPDDFKQRFPSLKSIYENLSADLHSAGASEDVFSQAKNDIEKHFKALELYI